METKEKGKLFQFKLTIVEMEEHKRRKREQRLAEGGHLGASAREQEITELYSEDSEDLKIQQQRSEQFNMVEGDEESEHWSGSKSTKDEKMR